MLHSSDTRTARVEQQPQHQGVLHVLGGIHDLVERPELVGGQDAGELHGLGGRMQVALLANPAGDIPPVLVGQPGFADESCQFGDQTGISPFQFCAAHLSGFSGVLTVILASDLPSYFVFQGKCEIVFPQDQPSSTAWMSDSCRTSMPAVVVHPLVGMASVAHSATWAITRRSR